MDVMHRATRPLNTIIIAGCGSHFRSVYLRVLERHSARLTIALAIDLQCEESRVLETFSESAIKPRSYLFLPDRLRNDITREDLHAALAGFPLSGRADGLLLCTEPKAHKAYLLWALGARIAVFTDKPITAFRNCDSFDSLLTDYELICAESKKTGTKVVVSCERRKHAGYSHVERFLRSFIEEQRVPITYVNAHFAGGIWVMPWEFAILENHPLKYGYGVLLHSGYHYIDLVSRLAELNCVLRDVDLERPTVRVNPAFPHDMDDALGQTVFDRLLPEQRRSEMARCLDRSSLMGYGEIDISMIGSYRAAGLKCLDFSLQLLSTSVSSRVDVGRRTGREPTAGRMRQEEILIHLGNLCTISIHSSPFAPLCQSARHDDFNITIACNPRVAKGRPLITVDRAELSRLNESLRDTDIMNVVARRSLVEDFINGLPSESEIGSHRATLVLLTEVFREMEREKERSRAGAANG